MNEEFYKQKYLKALIFIMVIFIILDGLFLYNFYLESQEVDGMPEIKFEGYFTEYEKEWVFGLISRVDEKYMQDLEEITFSKNFAEAEEGHMYGYNRRVKYGEIMTENKIFIYMIEKEYSVGEILCHELLHSSLRLEERNHDLIYHLANSGVCYNG